MSIMENIKCQSCRYFGKLHEKGGGIVVQSGVVHVEEPYVTCGKHKYYVLVSKIDECNEYVEKIKK